MFIFDGLDESRFTLDFLNSKVLTDPTASASLDVLLTNLINGHLLPSAFLWITSRPAASSEIPPVCIHRVTEVRGFSDPQKDEYFRKRISDQDLANKIITHLKSSRSLYIMCHMPVFCWIAATVLEGMFSEEETGEVPKTLTQMFTHFLILQIKRGCLKYKKQEMDPGQVTDIVVKLGKLAFQQLEKRNLIFYEEDLLKCGIDVREATVYSGVCTQIFIEEVSSHLGKMYSFVHLSVQEHLAAVFVFLSCVNGNISKQEDTKIFDLSSTATLLDLLKAAVDKALKSKTGHLDLFLRFLMGLSLESNSVLLQAHLTETGRRYLRNHAAATNKEITTYIKEKIGKNPSECKSSNLFHCLNELNDQSLMQEVQTFVSKTENNCLHGVRLSPVQWSALNFLLLNSDEKLDVFDLHKYAASEYCFINLCSAVSFYRKAVLCNSDLTMESCKSLAKALRSPCSCLKELDLSDNKLKDSGVELLSPVLNSPHCKLEILRLGNCDLTEKSCGFLASVLTSKSNHLKELCLSYNKLQDSGVKKLCEALQSPDCKLQTLRLRDCHITEEGCPALTGALRTNVHLRELDLSANDLKEEGVKLLTDIQKDENCTLEKLEVPTHHNKLQTEADRVTTPTELTIEADMAVFTNKLLPWTVGVFPKKLLPKGDNVALYAKAQRSIWKSSIQKPFDIIQRVLGITRVNMKDIQVIACEIEGELDTSWKQSFKSKLQKKFERISEGILKYGNSRLLNEVYTELCITSEFRCSHVYEEHEVSYSESCRSLITEESINCNDIFKALPGDERPIRTLLTEGIAGIGKTVSVQKFVLDWTEGKANQDLDFIFPFNFRKLNFQKKKCFSLLELLNFYFPETKNQIMDFHHYRIMFIFDGLDESRFTFDFLNSKVLTDPTASASLDVLLTNLINGNLLPSAFLWITSRPAASSEIPPVCIHRVTEVRGFSDPQKDEYFRKRISDQDLANKIITHLKSSRSLYIMCHMPVFCWIAATVLEGMFSEEETGEVPKTLTQMFTHFLILQIKRGCLKYKKQEVDPGQVTDIVVKLGKLAFQQLEKRNLIFYEEDLLKCGIDVREATVYSGVCTQIFIEEVSSHLGKVYSFVHLSVQEHLAAVFVFLSCVNGNLSKQEVPEILDLSSTATLLDLLKAAVAKALKSKTGHLDLFLRFLMGLSLESNSVMLQGHLTETGRRYLRNHAAATNKEITTYIKEKIRKNPSEKKSINLFRCLNELDDQSLVQEVQHFLSNRVNHCLRGVKLSAVQWSALVFLLLNSNEVLEEFDLQKYAPSDDCLMKLHQVVAMSRKALLHNCQLTQKSCAVIVVVLTSKSTHLIELSLGHNNLQDSGVKSLSGALQSPCCKLKSLSLDECGFTEEGCISLAEALKSNSHLRELDLCANDLGEQGVKMLTDIKEDENYTLEKLK
ncbi:NLR family CARD domain-containing protein 3 isoform X3 [Silurus meridionalis]|nr:NLR family CARD domain-containing protein 3 isoform X3 [Silurus meridionalis]